MSMPDDPIVTEIRALREELMRELGNDLDALFQYLQKREALHPERLISFPPRRPQEIGSHSEQPSDTKGV